MSIENMLLMTLEYIRKYRTYFRISQSYGVSKSTAYKTVRWIEDTLIKLPDFGLPGPEALLKSDVEDELVLIDATETPKKSSQKNPLTKEDKKANQWLSRKRIPNENVIGSLKSAIDKTSFDKRDLKRFKISSDRYRNRSKGSLFDST